MNYVADRQDIRHLAHDVRGLLACVQLEICALGVHEDESVRKRACLLERATDRLAEYCAGAIVEHDTQSLTTEFHESAAVIADAVALLAAEASSIQIVSDVWPDANLPLSTSEANGLHRMMINLGRNAIRAMQDRPGACLKLDARYKKRSLVIDIVDNGPGLPEYVLDYLFPSRGGQDPSSRRVGLGLASTRRLASKFGGDLILLRSDRRGAAFRIVLPHTVIDGVSSNHGTVR